MIFGGPWIFFIYLCITEENYRFWWHTFETHWNTYTITNIGLVSYRNKLTIFNGNFHDLRMKHPIGKTFIKWSTGKKSGQLFICNSNNFEAKANRITSFQKKMFTGCQFSGFKVRKLLSNKNRLMHFRHLTWGQCSEKELLQCKRISLAI